MSGVLTSPSPCETSTQEWKHNKQTLQEVKNLRIKTRQSFDDLKKPNRWHVVNLILCGRDDINGICDKGRKKQIYQHTLGFMNQRDLDFIDGFGQRETII